MENNNSKDINKLEKPNLYYVKVTDENGKYVIRQARFKKLLCRIDSLCFDTETDKLTFANGKIKSELELAGVDTSRSPITELNFDGSYLNGMATFEAAKDETNNIFYFFTHGGNGGNEVLIRLEEFGATYKKFESKLKKNFEVRKQVYWENDEKSEEYEVKVFGWYWNGTEAIAEELTDEIYYDILKGGYEIPYKDSSKKYYPSWEACEKDNKIVCYRFND